jgi:hypothetical protein
MAPRLTAAIAVGAATCLAIAGCGDGDGPTSASTVPASPASYVAAVERLVGPPAELASAVDGRAHDLGGAPPSGARFDEIIAQARARLAELRALRLDDGALRASRDRLATAYAALLPRMRAVADALGGRDRADLVAAANPFLDALRTLPSGASSSSP